MNNGVLIMRRVLCRQCFCQEEPRPVFCHQAGDFPEHVQTFGQLPGSPPAGGQFPNSGCIPHTLPVPVPTLSSESPNNLPSSNVGTDGKCLPHRLLFQTHRWMTGGLSETRIKPLTTAPPTLQEDPFCSSEMVAICSITSPEAL